jgi:CDP-diacylglycerol pyrophosphatase
MLAIPTRSITGIEDPQMLAPDAPKVFATAWAAKALVEARLHVVLPRQAVAIAINSKWARSQDQFHLHVDCVARNVAATLADSRASFNDAWRPMAVPLNGRVYFARRVDSADLADVAPLKLLADGLEGARAHMDAYSLAAVGATFEGKPGFVLLADQFSLERGGHAEDLQDHDCAIARPTPWFEREPAAFGLTRSSSALSFRAIGASLRTPRNRQAGSLG